MAKDPRPRADGAEPAIPGVRAPDLFANLRAQSFEIQMVSHAEAIVRHDMGSAATEIEEVLGNLRIPVEELVRGGGGEARATKRLRRALAEKGWAGHSFEIRRIIDGEEKESVSHSIDHVKRFGGHTFALEIEWNNKDPFFDRDLENFKRLHADGAISVGCIITRGRTLHEGLEGLISSFAQTKGIENIEQLTAYYQPTGRQCKNILQSAARLGSFPEGWAAAFVGDKFGESTTHWRKLQERIQRGVGNPCPLLLIGIPVSAVVST